MQFLKLRIDVFFVLAATHWEIYIVRRLSTPWQSLTSFFLVHFTLHWPSWYDTQRLTGYFLTWFQRFSFFFLLQFLNRIRQKTCGTWLVKSSTPPHPLHLKFSTVCFFPLFPNVTLAKYCLNSKQRNCAVITSLEGAASMSVTLRSAVTVPDRGRRIIIAAEVKLVFSFKLIARKLLFALWRVHVLKTLNKQIFHNFKGKGTCY